MKVLNIITLIIVIFFLTNCSNETQVNIQTDNIENEESLQSIEDTNAHDTDENLEIEENYNWVIVPDVSFGDILANNEYVGLYKIYSRENVTNDSVHVGEGFYQEASILFKDTPNEATVFWQEEYEYPEKIVINKENSDWIINNNIKVGTTLDELIELNNGVFNLTGFAWDYGGTVLSWEGGNLEEMGSIIIRLSGDYEKLGGEEQKQISGDIQLWSDNEILEKIDLKVSEIVFYFE